MVCCGCRFTDHHRTINQIRGASVLPGAISSIFVTRCNQLFRVDSGGGRTEPNGSVARCRRRCADLATGVGARPYAGRRGKGQKGVRPSLIDDRSPNRWFVPWVSSSSPDIGGRSGCCRCGRPDAAWGLRRMTTGWWCARCFDQFFLARPAGVRQLVILASGARHYAGTAAIAGRYDGVFGSISLRCSSSRAQALSPAWVPNDRGSADGASRALHLIGRALRRGGFDTDRAGRVRREFVRIPSPGRAEIVCWTRHRRARRSRLALEAFLGSAVGIPARVEE